MNSHFSRSSGSTRVRSKAVLNQAVFQRKVAGFPPERQLWLQAGLDGKLPEGEGQREGKTSTHYAQARSLLEELSLVKSALASGELERRVPQSREGYWNQIERAIHQRPSTPPPGAHRPASRDAGLFGVLRKESIMKNIMKTSNRLWGGITCAGLSLALAGAVALPVSAGAASNGSPAKSVKTTEQRQEFRAMHEKMLAQAKAEDAALEKMVAELNKAPEVKKVDLEAAILTKLVAQHHQMLGQWESLHARMMQFRKQHRQVSQTGMPGGCAKPGMMGQQASAAQK